MQACIEAAAPPAAIPGPAWALRVAGRATDGRRMAEAMQGVPKPALQTIFGKCLGGRLWDQAQSRVGPHPMGVSDSEISAGMLAYVSGQAADALRSAGRQATGIAINITYTNGETKLARTPLAWATNAAGDIADAATKLLRQVAAHDATIAAIRLSMTTIECLAVRETSNDVACSMQQATARA